MSSKLCNDLSPNLDGRLLLNHEHVLQLLVDNDRLPSFHAVVLNVPTLVNLRSHVLLKNLFQCRGWQLDANLILRQILPTKIVLLDVPIILQYSQVYLGVVLASCKCL
jgi:hypothetical protein